MLSVGSDFLTYSAQAAPSRAAKCPMNDPPRSHGLWRWMGSRRGQPSDKPKYMFHLRCMRLVVSSGAKT
eukprot:6936683-Pyramimonas_sp.AAC.1